MSEIIFIVEEAPEGGYTARALRESIFAEADDLAQLEAEIRDAVRCHFEDDQRPSLPWNAYLSHIRIASRSGALLKHGGAPREGPGK